MQEWRSPDCFGVEEFETGWPDVEREGEVEIISEGHGKLLLSTKVSFWDEAKLPLGLVVSVLEGSGELDVCVAVSCSNKPNRGQVN